MKKLSKKTLRQSWFRWFMSNLSSMSFQWLETFAFADSMAPVVRELYGGDREEEVAALKRHAAFYNTEPQLGSVINGVMCGLEEERANGADIDEEVINGIKLLLSIAISLSQGGSVAGPLFYIVTYLAGVTAASYYLFMKGYELGTKSVDIIVGEAAQRIRESFNLLGAIVVGGVGASYVSIATGLVIATGNDQSQVIVNDVINGIYPKLLTLAGILLCWWLMAKKKVSALKVMGILVLISLAGVAVGFF